ncbi:MAG: arginine--tRNA ligase [Dehalococcoidales bacterium]|jgi:arginyl-tRNA synthetase|nr:arginine--tRNA ligase [Dehalococcoidales bacterium]MDD3264602.1 arginine--tRNA ligase [Dehalococcoidales bacterium]MDD4322087.1 arginine--tRNA ligase [Dehalococcoidales bacterium]MDD4793658.1 arginine--tRNA ligase [Dehalococcoidales bacterium]MDD5122161.1 arginine--tRNA ligase [Dehalococcoidales bacterium]
MTNILTLKQKLTQEIENAIKKAQDDGSLPRVPVPSVVLEHPQRSEHGDIATSLPLKLARAMAKKPSDIAAEITRNLSPMPEISGVEVALPGFINFTISPAWLSVQVNMIINDPKGVTKIDAGKGKKVQVEFVSVNPTGPLHVGHGRGAVLGSTLANVLEACGYHVSREYYINDAGSQIDAFKRSLFARYQQEFGIEAEVPQEGYFGAYMVELARDLAGEIDRKYLDMSENDAIKELGEIGLNKMIAEIRKELAVLKVEFDEWFSERSLYSDGYYQKAISILQEGGYLANKEFATWFVSTSLGDSKDNVVIRSDGSPTYFAADIAYHYNKFIARGFDRVIDIWGADHQGHVSRMKNVLGAMDIDPGRLDVIISQMVTLKRGGELVRISKRSGELITLKEVVEEVGADVCRYFFLSRSADSQMDFDLELAMQESSENPVYYIQYAHARIASILRLAKEEDLTHEGGDTALLNDSSELALMRRLVELPEVIEMVAKSLEPHHLAYYALDLATLFHSFYKQCRVVQKDKPELSRARLKLVIAAKAVFASTLNLMGMTVPESM